METLEITDLKDMLKKTENFGNKPAYKIRQGEGKYKIIAHKEMREMVDVRIAVIILDSVGKCHDAAMVSKDAFKIRNVFYSRPC